MDIYFKYVPQRQYYITGVPAGKAGDWYGYCSNHWRGSKKIIDYFKHDEFDKTMNFFKRPMKLVKEEKKSSEYILRHKRIISPKKDGFCTNYEKNKGIRKIDFCPIERKEMSNRRHFPNISFLGKEENKISLKTFKLPNNNLNFSENEIFVEKQMGTKKKVCTLNEQRNNLPQKKPGDKLYSTVEQFNNFFKEEGIVPGSTNAINFNRTQSLKTYNFYETMDLSKVRLKPDLIWKNKLNNESFNSDKTYVEQNLSKWEKNILLDFVPNYFDKPKKVEIKKITKNDNKKIKKK